MSTIGTMDRYVSLQEDTSTKNNFNEDIISYTELTKCWAEIRPLTGKEKEFANSISSTINYAIRIRTMIGLTDSIKATYRIVDTVSDEIYNIDHSHKQRVKQDEFTICYCTLKDT